MKSIFVTLVLISFLNAGYEKVKIGTISNYHKKRITPLELKQIIDEIEKSFESQLGFNVFDYSSDGKPIDLLYISPSIAQKRLDRKVASYKRKIDKSKFLISYFPKAKSELNRLQNQYNNEANILNESINDLNSYINEINKKTNYPKNEYDKIKTYINKQKQIINTLKKRKNSLERKLLIQNTKYNNKVNSYNNLINQTNSLAFEIESLSRSLKVVRGQAIGEKRVTYKTYVENGKFTKEKNIENIMNKIEIYSFDDKKQLKVILAHEIAHLVGIPHINVQKALMNPILQANQVNNLKLTKEDIKAFKNYF